jgi:acetolactate synthase-1/2/3 large subunit
VNETPPQARVAATTTTVGDLVAAFLDACGVKAAFGVISIHNMPVLDAIGRAGRIRFVPARGEAGALNMADAFARVSGGLGSGLGVGITSTGVGAGNAAGSLVEAKTAGTPLLHITGQIESDVIDRGLSHIHEFPDQPRLLDAVSKAYFRIWSPERAIGVLREAVRVALTPPTGPVSVEIPIDVQAAPVAIPTHLAPAPITPPAAQPADVGALAAMLKCARRPLLWLGGGARGAAEPVRRLAEHGIGVVTSVNGRGILPEDHPLTLGAFNLHPPVEDFYRTCDLMIVAGSRLRGNETLRGTLALPQTRARIDADPAMDGRGYDSEIFVHGDCADALSLLADALPDRLDIDPAFAGDLAAAKAAAVASMRDGLGPYAPLVDALRAAMPKDSPWVRDVTVANSTWGNRYIDLHHPRQGVHALGGGIGQGVPMAIGAALAAGPARKTVALAGDGGLGLSLGELATAVEAQAEIVLIVMNDQGYGVIRNIQDARYGGRQVFSDVAPPQLDLLARSIGLAHQKVEAAEAFGPAFAAALERKGPSMIEVDMTAIGPYAHRFAGPPVRPKA